MKFEKIEFKAIKVTFNTSKKGKITVHESKQFFRVKCDGTWKTVREIVGNDAKSDFLPFADTFSEVVCRAKMPKLYTLCGLDCPQSVLDSAKKAEEKIAARAKAKEIRERAIVAAGRDAFVKKGSESYGTRWDKLSEIYHDEGEDAE